MKLKTRCKNIGISVSALERPIYRHRPQKSHMGRSQLGAFVQPRKNFIYPVKKHWTKGFSKFKASDFRQLHKIFTLRCLGVLKNV